MLSSTHEDISGVIIENALNAINIEIFKISLLSIIRFSIIREALLRMQKSTIMKFKEHSRNLLN